MPSSNFINFLLIAALLLPHKRATAEDDWSGYHGDERDALLGLKTRFNNPFLDANWTGIMCYMDKTPYWHGVQCLKGRVTGLILDSMGLAGEIKVDALVNLTELETLSFKNNSITGNMMELTLNQKLRNIDLSGNRFGGEIPSSLLNLNSLESLQLQGNRLSGWIPGLKQSSLTRFNVSHNNLSGEIPETETLQLFDLSCYFGNENLCGRPTPTMCSVEHGVSESNSDDSGGKGHDSGRLVGILLVVDAIVVVVIMFLLIVYYKKYKKLRKEMKGKEMWSSTRDEEHDSRIVERVPEGEKGKLVFVENDGTTRFDLDDLLRASAEGLGKGNFGNCYKAMMEVGPPVVVKRLRDLKPLNRDEFVRQVTAIAHQKHPNLLPLLAYFYSKDEKLFLYRFASNGNLFNRLHGGRGTTHRLPFRWNSRLAVARAVARALNHLHHNTRSHTAIHANLKSSNVLIDDNHAILLADYGLASLIALPIAAQRMVAYKCPEYLSNKTISKKSDVWNYGGLLLELLTGRVSAYSAPPGMNGVDLCSWVHRAVREEWTAEIFDAEMAVHKDANRGMLRLMQIALKCCDRSPEKRPEMGQVVAEVEEIKGEGESEDEEFSYNSYSSYDRSLTVTDDSLSVTTSV